MNYIALLFVMSFLMLCNDISYYKPLQGVVSSGSKRGKQRTLGVLISGLKAERCGETGNKPGLAEAGRAMAPRTPPLAERLAEPWEGVK